MYMHINNVPGLSCCNTLYHISSKQCEKHYPNGTKEILFPDKTVKYIYSNGGEECIFPDGSVQTFHPNGERTIKFANGQQEIHTREFKVEIAFPFELYDNISFQ